MRRPICEVTIIRPFLVKATFAVRCNECDRLLGTFSQHESAMNWAQAHAWSSKHLSRREVKR